MKAFIFILLGCFTLNHLEGQNNLFEAACFKHASYGFSLIDLASKKSIVSIHEDQSLIPASILKVVSTSTALLEFGSDYHIQTPLGYTGFVKDSVLYGNLIIVGSGDPTLGSNRFSQANVVEEWVKQIRGFGIRTIQGKLMADLSTWSRNYVPQEWFWGDLGNYYGAAFTPLMYQENAYELHLASKAVGDSVEVKQISSPALLQSLSFDCRLTAANNTIDNAYILGGPLSSNRQIVGTIPAHKNDFIIKGSIPFPAKLLLLELNQALGGNNETQVTYHAQPCKVLYKHSSPSLLAIVKVTNLVSHNLFAESLAQQCILKLKNDSTAEFSHDPLLAFWKQRGIDTEGLTLYDGCGLSPRDLVSTKFMTQLLAQIYDSPIAKDFISTLPVAGQSGTLKYFLKDTPFSGKVFAKSGSMTGVRSYAGYLSKDGKNYAFCIIVNNYQGDSVLIRKAIESILMQSIPSTTASN